MGKKAHAHGKRRMNGRRLGGHTASTNERQRRRYAAVPGTEEAIRLQEGRVDRMDARARAIENKRRQLAAAELQATAAQESLSARKASPSEKAWLADLWAVVALRRAELEELERMMTAYPAGAQHRGPESFRPVPDMSRASRI